jgi:16S rRNA (guanine966-N2)-methyltransferase
MRVIAGIAKGRTLRPVPGSRTRPISARVKTALFDILSPRIAGARALDLFAGTGSVGIEALSRGAAHVTFVEQNRQAVQVIRHNLCVTGLASEGRVVLDDVFRYLSRRADTRFDIVYIAPPQYGGLWSRTVRALERTLHLAERGVVIAQIFPKEFIPLDLTRLQLIDQRRYGSTLLCFYQPADAQAVEAD